MGTLGEAVVEIRPNMKPLDAGLTQAEGKLGKFVGSGNAILGGLGAGITMAGVGYALANATKAAGNLEESVSKVKATFGGNSTTIMKFADELAAKYGKVKQATLDASVGFGLLGLSVKLSADKSAKLGNELTMLAADLESFHNVGFDEVATALKSGLSGEAEPLRRFGVFLTEDAVKAEALRLGLTKTTASISEQAKVLARLSLIKQNPAILKAQGDLARTQDSSMNQLRKFEGELQNFKTEFGKNFLDPMTKGIKTAHDLGNALDALSNIGGKSDKAGKFAETISALLSEASMALKDPVRFAKLNAAALMGGPGAAAAKQELQAWADKEQGVQHAGDKAVPAPGKIDPLAEQAKIRAARLAELQLRFNRQRGKRLGNEGRGEREQLGREIVDAAQPLIKGLKALTVLGSGNKFERDFAKGALGGLAPFLGGAGKAMVTGLNMVGKAREERKEMPEFQKLSGEAFHDLLQKEAIDRAGGKGNMTEQQLKAQEDGNKILGEVKTVLGSILEKTGKAVRQGMGGPA